MYQKKNTLASIIREKQVSSNITELTVFDTTDSGDPKVCFSGLLEDFNSIGKHNIKMKQYRHDLLKRSVKQKIDYVVKLFVWLEPELSANHTSEDNLNG